MISTPFGRHSLPYLCLLLLLILLATAGCSGDDVSAAPLDPQTEQVDRGLPEEIRELTQVAGDEPDAGEPAPVAATGELVAFVHSELVARQAGRIGRILADEGQTVAKDEALLEIEADYLELAVAAARAELARADAGLGEADRELERKKGLLEKESISQAVYDRVEAASDGARAARQLAQVHLELAETRLADAVLRSPIDGVVAERRVDVGESLNPSKVAFVIVQTKPLKLRFQLPERYLPAVRKGLSVCAYVEPYPGESFEGKISVVGQVIDPASRSLVVEAVFQNADGRLRPGLFARVELDLGGVD